MTEKDDYRRRVMTGFSFRNMIRLCHTSARQPVCYSCATKLQSDSIHPVLNPPVFCSALLCPSCPVNHHGDCPAPVYKHNECGIRAGDNRDCGVWGGVWDLAKNLWLDVMEVTGGDWCKQRHEQVLRGISFPSCPESPRWSILSLILYPSFEPI